MHTAQPCGMILLTLLYGDLGKDEDKFYECLNLMGDMTVHYDAIYVICQFKYSRCIFAGLSVDSMANFQSLDTWWKAKSLGFTPYRVTRSNWLEGKDM